MGERGRGGGEKREREGWGTYKILIGDWNRELKRERNKERGGGEERERGMEDL